MNRWLFIGSALFLAAACFGPSWLKRLEPVAEDGAYAAAAKSGHRLLAAAKGLFRAFDADQQTAAVFPFGSKEQTNWHFIPRSRKGVPLEKMTDAQREKTKALLHAGLSQLGFEKAEQVRQLEAVLAEIEGPNRRFPRNPLHYFVSFFNQPTATGKWGWRYEGHHLCLNFVLDGDTVLSHTPGMYGSNPATVKKGPRKGLQVLEDVEVVARELVTSLNEKHRKALLGEEVPEEVPSTQKASYDGPLPAGVSGSSLSAAQKEMLKKLIDAYVKKYSADLSEATWKKIKGAGGLDKIHLAWLGSLKAEERHSYLIHGPTFVINYSNWQNEGKHVHASFRVLGGDFGK